MEKEEKRHRLLGATAIAARYCVTVENAAESDERDFIKEVLQLLFLQPSKRLDQNYGLDYAGFRRAYGSRIYVLSRQD